MTESINPFFYAELARITAEEPVKCCYWPENAIDWPEYATKDQTQVALLFIFYSVPLSLSFQLQPFVLIEFRQKKKVAKYSPVENLFARVICLNAIRKMTLVTWYRDRRIIFRLYCLYKT